MLPSLIAFYALATNFFKAKIPFLSTIIHKLEEKEMSKYIANVL